VAEQVAEVWGLTQYNISTVSRGLKGVGNLGLMVSQTSPDWSISVRTQSYLTKRRQKDRVGIFPFKMLLRLSILIEYINLFGLNSLGGLTGALVPHLPLFCSPVAKFAMYCLVLCY